MGWDSWTLEGQELLLQGAPVWLIRGSCWEMTCLSWYHLDIAGNVWFGFVNSWWQFPSEPVALRDGVWFRGFLVAWRPISPGPGNRADVSQFFQEPKLWPLPLVYSWIAERQPVPSVGMKWRQRVRKALNLSLTWCSDPVPSRALLWQQVQPSCLGRHPLLSRGLCLL